MEAVAASGWHAGAVGPGARSPGAAPRGGGGGGGSCTACRFYPSAARGGPRAPFQGANSSYTLHFTWVVYGTGIHARLRPDRDHRHGLTPAGPGSAAVGSPCRPHGCLPGACKINIAGVDMRFGGLGDAASLRRAGADQRSFSREGFNPAVAGGDAGETERRYFRFDSPICPCPLIQLRQSRCTGLAPARIAIAFRSSLVEFGAPTGSSTPPESHATPSRIVLIMFDGHRDLQDGTGVAAARGIALVAWSSSISVTHPISWRPAPGAPGSLAVRARRDATELF